MTEKIALTIFLGLIHKEFKIFSNSAVNNEKLFKLIIANKKEGETK